jgi:hypothetical protein
LPDLSVVDELAAYLVAQGVAQLPDQPPSDALPSLWAMTLEGVPGPREGESITITLRDTLLAPAATLEAWIQETFMDVIVRSRSEPAGTFVQRQIAGLIHPTSAHGGKTNWDMGQLRVEYSTIWRGDQPLPPADPNDPTFDRVQSFRFGCRRKALAGQPLVP